MVWCVARKEKIDSILEASFVVVHRPFFERVRDFPIQMRLCVCVCEWEKFIILKGGLVAKNMCICKAIFKRLLLFLGTVQCCWMSGAKGILQNDIYAFFFSLACICCCCSLKEVNEFYNLIKSSIHSIVIHICSCHNAHIIAVVVPHSKWNDFQNGFKLCTHINADDTLSSSLLLLFL